MLFALLLDSGFRRNDEFKAASELSGKAPCIQHPPSGLSAQLGKLKADS
jgi:hypothetical protein